ncbi:methyl-accepting chemotaxis protein [Paraglaciecola hydrolytica]|uniref:Chemotaxis protein n=1 Tax=Paraglaciecola hydrolytica TaxID=1799789 RepID=A0A148KLA6_9ALTE|nr:methyl-accepting chemotaxis protein [Paraglaciecola hydrolytica]KXI27093.1 chemotaxis protein [Paraglaciecola hydrolytica]
MLNSTSVKTRLGVMAILPGVFFAVMAILVNSIMKTQNQGIESLYADRVVPLKQIKLVSDNYAVSIVDLLHKYRAGMLSDSQVLNRIKQSENIADEQWDAYINTKLTERESDLVNKTKRNLPAVQKLIEKYKKMINEGTLVSYPANTFNAELYEVFDQLSQSYEALIDLQQDESLSFRDASHEKFVSTERALIIASILVLILMFSIAFLIYRSIQRPLNKLQNTITDIAEKANLTLRAEVEGDDEFAKTAESFNLMLDRIHTLVMNVSEATLTLASAAEEMQTISTQVATTANEQELQNTMIATAITEMSSAIQEVANSALKTSTRATDADKQAVLGQAKVKQNIQSITDLSKTVDSTTEVIQKLHDQANEINQVVQLIKGVAEQTNLLALNAAIEAARAGDSGRGFAVVADEVRQLAHNTQKATESISEMIGRLQNSAKQSVDSMSKAQERANESVDHAKDSSIVLQEIITAMSEIANMNTQVSVATEEQTMVASEISKNVNEFSISIAVVNESSQQNAIASGELTQLADKLQKQISIFKINKKY